MAKYFLLIGDTVGLQKEGSVGIKEVGSSGAINLGQFEPGDEIVFRAKSEKIDNGSERFRLNHLTFPDGEQSSPFDHIKEEDNAIKVLVKNPFPGKNEEVSVRVKIDGNVYPLDTSIRWPNDSWEPEFLFTFRIIDGALGSKAAVVVLRHGEDIKSTWPTEESDGKLADWKKLVNDHWPVYSINSKEITLLQHGLSKEPGEPKGDGSLRDSGETQAIVLKEELNKFLSGKCEDISRVITKDPTIIRPNKKFQNPTPNPFDTVYPFIKENNLPTILIAPAETDGIVIDPDLDKMIEDGSLYLRDNSTLLCWDAEGLWGPKEDGKGRPLKANSILGKLSAKYLGEANAISEYDPNKCKTIYIFTPCECSIYEFSSKNKSFSLLTTLKVASIA